MQRHITCYGYYEDKLRQQLLSDEDDDLSRPRSLVYFDEKYIDEYIGIFEMLLNRTECKPPRDLTEIVQVKLKS